MILLIYIILFVFFLFSLGGKTPKEKKEKQQNLLSYAEFLTQFTSNINRYLSLSECEKITKRCVEEGLQSPSVMRFFSYPRWQFTWDYLKQLNIQFLKKEGQKYDYLFSNILGYSLDAQQREAIMRDEDRQLIVAGAGAGKTLTIVGKVAYLVKSKNIKPEEILLISFTRKSAEEMSARVSKQLGAKVDAMTFHKLGLNIIRNNTTTSPNIAEDNVLEGIINKYYKNSFESSDKKANDLLNFLAYYLHVPADKQEFKNFGEFLNAERSADLETLKSKYEKKENLQSKQTLFGEKVKSLEEVLIANFLFLNGVKYEYERPYPYKWYGYGTYKPDFYLPDYDIYIEHFGLDKEGKCKWLPYSEARKYEKKAWEKKRLHEDMGTKLIETYSYYQSEGVLLDKLRELLKENGVKFKKVDKEAVLKEIYLRQDRGLKEFNNLINTFIKLFKAQGYTLADLNYWERMHISNKYLADRKKLFLSIIKDIYEEYQSALKQSDSIDFSDMIANATNIVKNSRCRFPYKYIIIDEYQDIGQDRYKLIKAILGVTGAKLTCIGDDWQSIYRFTGSDISLFTSFGTYWGQYFTSRIEKTYRNSQELIDICGKFIMSNKKQIDKKLVSDKRIIAPIQKVEYGKDTQAEYLEDILDAIYKESGPSSVLLLGRNNYDINFLEKADDSNCTVLRSDTKVKVKYDKHPDLDISFLTVHSAKGLEAENVVIINCKNEYTGFPNKIADDPILQLLLSEPESYRYAEERRLMYVALTRTKKRTYLLTPRKDPSEFVLELDKMGVTTLNSISGEHNNTPQYTCTRCGAKMVVRTNNSDGSKFYGCSNYPRCTYVLNIEIPYSDDESEKQSSQVSNKYKDTDTVSTFKMPLIDEKVVLSKKESALHRLVSNKQEKKTLAEIYASNEGSIKEAILAKISTKKKTSTKRKKAKSVTVKAKTNKKTSKVKITRQKRTISKSRKRSL